MTEAGRLIELLKGHGKTTHWLPGHPGLKFDREATLVTKMRTVAARQNLLLVCILLSFFTVPALAAPSDYTPGTHTITASSSNNYVHFCVPPGMIVSDFREVSASQCSRYWIGNVDNIATNYYGEKGPVILWDNKPVIPGEHYDQSYFYPVWGCGDYQLYTNENCGPVTISYVLSNAGAGPSSGCPSCEYTPEPVVPDPVVPPKEPDIPWEVVIGVAVVGAGAVGAAVVVKKGSGKSPPPPKSPPQKIIPPPPPPQQPPSHEEKKPKTIRYILWLNREELTLTHENHEFIDAIARKELDDGRIVDAPEAVIEIALDPSSVLEVEKDIEFPYRHVFTVNQEKGSAAAVNEKKTALSDPKEFELERVEVVRVMARAGTSQISHDIKVNIRLPRWFPLCFGVKLEWLINPINLKEETHLRTNYATVLKEFRDAIEKFNATEPYRAHLGYKAGNNFYKAYAGKFLFSHNPPEFIADLYYFTTRGDLSEIQGAGPKRDKGTSVSGWIEGSSRIKYPPSVIPETEASLAVKILATNRSPSGAGENKPVSPGEVFYLALIQTRGDIGAALLLAHNTVRSFARLGSNERTGINPIENTIFRSVFKIIRGGFRIIDGAPGEPRNGVFPGEYRQKNFAEDYSGPWYHLFGTAFYEIYTVGKEERVPSLTQGWAQNANKLEQWYREYWSWEAPDPEKFCVNLWGIAIADSLLEDQPWEDYSGKLAGRDHGPGNGFPGETVSPPPKPETTIGDDAGLPPKKDMPGTGFPDER